MDTLLRQLLLLVQPVGLIWLGSLTAAYVAWRKGARFSALICGALFILVTLCGGTDLPGWMLRRLEAPWIGFDPASATAADAIVVLGGGAEPSRHEVGGVHLTKAADRIVMGAELARLGKAPVLVVGGGGAELDSVSRSEADGVKALIESWKIVPAREVISLGITAHTRDEATKVRELANTRNWRRIILVTSASHMSRAAATFRQTGLEVTPAACNFVTSISTSAPPFRLNVPSWHGFEKISIWAHEVAGTWIYRRRGWLAE